MTPRVVELASRSGARSDSGRSRSRSPWVNSRPPSASSSTTTSSGATVSETIGSGVAVFALPRLGRAARSSIVWRGIRYPAGRNSAEPSGALLSTGTARVAARRPGRRGVSVC